MKVQRACKELMINEPFYGLFLLNLDKETTTDLKYCDTAMVTLNNLSFKLVVNEDFWAKQDDMQQIGLIKHEMMHLCLFHLNMMDRFPDKEMANIAMDMEINQYIMHLPDGGVNLHKYKKEVPSFKDAPEKAGSKVYYELLTKAKKNKELEVGDDGVFGPGGPGQGPPDSNGNQLSDNGSQSSHKNWEALVEGMTDAEKRLLENQLESMVRNTVEQVEKSRGTIPGELREMITKVMQVDEAIFNWKAYFRRLLGVSFKVFTKKSLRKESKRFVGSAGLKIKQKHNILVGIDTSGSVSSKELIEFFSEITHIYKSGASVTIIECDTQINANYEYKGVWNGNVHGRGGTRFEPVIEYYNQHKDKFTTLIYFTDGEAPLDFKVMKKMIWVISSNGDHQQKYPGFTVHIPKNK